ncbi:hypothetical protein [Hymenobacter perfusus]|uniref:Glycosyltransferase RgtA/B/C/D-like domain-containing protein n=1 Tax=Hymenobacter perfusus TaxID=1236770 RepID=A0A3R9MHX6_9BACT|nr:hypothetical protein [Hymenobacter perfusus]RSK42673.1 hypothetical protein EI293_12800 [Hymenobacter perfusus]
MLSTQIPLTSSSRSTGLATRPLYSLVTLLLLLGLMVQARLLAPYWDTRNVQAILTWDAMGYYLYLPAKFIYHDLRYLRFIPDIMREYGPSGSFYQAFPAPGLTDGTMVMKYPIGVALLEFPFFWLGHWAAALLGYPQDGFSAPYQVAIAFGGIAYGFLGLAVLRQVLRSFFSDAVTALTLVLVVLGTNYFQYAVFDAAMSHTYGFTLYAILLWYTVQWHRQPTRWRAAGIGLATGLLVLTRPSEAVAVLLPVLWGIDSKAGLISKLQVVRHRWPDVLVLLCCGVVAVLPQLLYWKWATGSFIVYSYQEQGFSFLHPHLREVLISFKKGWLVYTPLMLLVPLGLAVLFRQNRQIAVPVLAYGLATLWVVAAWDIWWYGGSFGQRALVSAYAALSLPLAALLAWCWTAGWRRLLGLGILLPVLVGLIDLNLFQHWQYMYGIIHTEDMTRPYYQAVFSKARVTQDDFSLLDVPTRIGQVTTHFSRRSVGELNFEGQPATEETGITNERGSSSGQSARLGNGHQYTPALVLKAADTGLRPGQWVRVSAQVYSDWGAWNDQLVLAIGADDKSARYYHVRLHNNGCVNKVWNDIWFDIPLPAEMQPTDVLKVFGVCNNGSPALLDNLRLELLTPQTMVAASR